MLLASKEHILITISLLAFSQLWSFIVSDNVDAWNSYAKNLKNSPNRVSAQNNLLNDHNSTSTRLKFHQKQNRRLESTYNVGDDSNSHYNPQGYYRSPYYSYYQDDAFSRGQGVSGSLVISQHNNPNSRDNGECTLPESWKGRWFHGGTYQHITLAPDSIGTYGKCVQRNRFYFLLHNTTRNCYQCLFITEKHRNLLHYKESYCMPKADINSICYTITGDAPLLSLYRADSIPVNCPLEKNRFKFYFQPYFRPCQGKAQSMLEICTQKPKFVLKFQSCDRSSEIANEDFEIQCIATWKEGTNNYFAAKMSFQSNDTLKDYRCFIYEKTHTGYYLSMSQSSNCYGLLSATEGPFVFDLQKDQYPGEISNIQFPQYFESFPTWSVVGLNGITDITYRFDSYMPHILQKYDGKNQLIEKMRFLNFYGGELNLQEENYGSNSANQIKYDITNNTTKDWEITNTSLDKRANGPAYKSDTMIVFTIVGCRQGYRCIKIKRKNDQIIQLYTGDLSPSPEAACLDTYTSHDDDPETLIVESMFDRASHCPLKGIHRTESESVETLKCRSAIIRDIHLGCMNETVIEVDMHCQYEKKIIPMKAISNQMTCHSHWHDDGATYILAKDKNTKLKKCFVFDHHQKLIRIEPLSQLNCFPTPKDIAKRSLSQSLSKYRILNSDSCEATFDASFLSRSLAITFKNSLVITLSVILTSTLMQALWL